MNARPTDDEIIDILYAISAFLVGNGDVCEIAASKLRKLARQIEDSNELS